MSRHNTMVFQNMRPPVASEKGNTPLRGKKVAKIFELANGEYEDKSGYRITMDQVVQNYTDDARLQDSVWDMRHHVTPSGFNTKNSKYYKVSQSDQSSLLSNIYIYLVHSNTLGKTIVTRITS